ncbi:uncharacterized protein LOC108096161 [Drosophila ficusphila]|uniref:uncharacterized protein LOC108096161 n=1 Tax=Drosophila ficusphila TaxID=30025 RepID=UPI0007E6167C|nr:uncharacterized protein LOC108096161 [Drosophila ficusphila]
MIPISSAKLNSKLASRSLLNEGRSYKKHCVCLLLGMTLGVFLAGIIFNSLLPNEKYKNNTKSLMKVIKLEVPQNLTSTAASSSIEITNKLEDKLGINNTQAPQVELNKSNDSLSV